VGQTAIEQQPDRLQDADALALGISLDPSIQLPREPYGPRPFWFFVGGRCVGLHQLVLPVQHRQPSRQDRADGLRAADRLRQLRNPGVERGKLVGL